jgi:hypothetical protein
VNADILLKRNINYLMIKCRWRFLEAEADSKKKKCAELKAELVVYVVYLVYLKYSFEDN